MNRKKNPRDPIHILHGIRNHLERTNCSRLERGVYVVLDHIKELREKLRQYEIPEKPAQLDIFEINREALEKASRELAVEKLLVSTGVPLEQTRQLRITIFDIVEGK